MKTLRPIVKTNFYLQLEYYEGILRGQTKRKPKPSDASKPKMVRSTSLPTIDALHAFKIEKSIEKQNELALEGGAGEMVGAEGVMVEQKPITPRAGGAHSLLHITIPNGSPRASPVPSPKGPFSPRDASPPVLTPRSMRRRSRSLYSELRVVLPKSESLPAVPLQEGAEGEGGNGEWTGKDSEGDEVGAGVPITVMRKASDFEDLSELHQLMRVHSLPELVKDGQQALAQRKLSKGKSFLKHTKINLLAEKTD